MLTATNDKVHDGTIAHVTFMYIRIPSRLSNARCVARCHDWAGKSPSSRPSLSITSHMGMGDYNENQSVLKTRMDDAFCARMRAAIEAGLESPPIGVVTTPGTQTPRYVPAEPPLPASPSGDTNF